MFPNVGKEFVMKRNLIYLTIVLLVVCLLVPLAHQSWRFDSEEFLQVELILEHNQQPIPGVEVEVFKGDSTERVAQTYSDSYGVISLSLNPDSYLVTAITNHEVTGIGYIGYLEFDVASGDAVQKIRLPMRPKSDHSVSAKIGPSSSSRYPSNIIALPLEGDSYGVPLCISEESPVYEEIDFISSLDDGETIWFVPPYFYGVIDNTYTYNKWHPIALIDSEYGLTHKMEMDFYVTEDMDITSEIEYKGVTATHSYSTSTTYSHGDENPIICSNGQSKTRLSEFKHVYQEGSLWMLIWNEALGQYIPDYRGDFQREWVDKWYTLSTDIEPGWVGISETRKDYLGQWSVSYSAWISMSGSSTTTGSLAYKVSRSDVFGASARIETSIQHKVLANHHLSWTRPSSSHRLKIYGGNMFDVNTYDYVIGGGGCPFVSTWNGDEFVLDNNILPQSEIYGTAIDWVDRYKLENQLERSSDGYVLSISEFENEHSFIDKVDLIAVTHGTRAYIAVSPDGEIIAYNKPRPPKTAVLDDGGSVIKLVRREDGRYFEGVAGDTLHCSFKTRGLANGARLILRADAATKFSIFVDLLTIDGWQEVGVIVPRIKWAHEILRLDEYVGMIPKKNVVDIRLRWTSTHKLDFIGIDTKKSPEYDITNLSLISAWHNIHGDVLDLMQHSDDLYAELLPGEDLFIAFEGLEFRARHVDFVFVVEGKYYSLG